MTNKRAKTFTWHWNIQLPIIDKFIMGKLSVCQWFVRVVVCAEETVWDRELNLWVHHNGEWKDLNCNQPWNGYRLLSFNQQDRKNERAYFCMPKVCSSRWRRMLWSMVSNAALRSRRERRERRDTWPSSLVVRRALRTLSSVSFSGVTSTLT